MSQLCTGQCGARGKGGRGPKTFVQCMPRLAERTRARTGPDEAFQRSEGGSGLQEAFETEVGPKAGTLTGGVGHLGTWGRYSRAASVIAESDMWGPVRAEGSGTDEREGLHVRCASLDLMQQGC